jgi:DNA helicase-2/ATP-dependent DNA helicase PcrA
MVAYYRLKNASDPTKTAQSYMEAYSKAAEAFCSGKTPNNKVAKALRTALHEGVTMTGEPVQDWRACLAVLDRVGGLEEIANQIRMVRLFRATDALGKGLADLWLSGGSYRTATVLVKKVLDQERLVSLEDEPRGCSLMNMHKSKGKEFDGVVLVEGAFESLFYDYNREAPPFIQSRRLLRVGITRARSRVILVRFAKAKALVG